MASWSAGDHRETDRREDVGRRKHPSDATVSDLTARSRGPGRRPARCTHRCARCTSTPGTRLRALLLREPLAAVTVSAAASHRLPWYRCHPGRGGGAPHCKREQENACVHGNLSGSISRRRRLAIRRERQRAITADSRLRAPARATAEAPPRAAGARVRARRRYPDDQDRRPSGGRDEPGPRPDGGRAPVP